MTTTKKMLQAAAGVGGALDIADAFSTDLYTGTGAAQTITNGIDLSGEGGLVWSKSRSNAQNNTVVDTERGDSRLYTNTTAAGDSFDLLDFNSDGFTLKTSGNNSSGYTYVAWSFRKAPKFFDVVTYTGDGVAGREIAHDLGSVPGMMIVKQLNAVINWPVFHRGLAADAETDGIYLDLSNQAFDSPLFWNDTAPTSSSFTVGGHVTTNGSGDTYVAYLFAHDTDASSVIQCGSYTGNGSTSGPVITLGWEPQWLMIKRSNAAANWHIFDAARGLTTSTDKSLRPNLSSAEMGVQGTYQATATGFTVNQAYNDFNASGSTYIYMAIRAEA
jgi:hypothetical protein